MLLKASDRKPLPALQRAMCMCQHVGGGAKVGMAPGSAVSAAGVGLSVSLAFQLAVPVQECGQEGWECHCLHICAHPWWVHQDTQGSQGSGGEQGSLQSPLSSPPQKDIAGHQPARWKLLSLAK